MANTDQQHNPEHHTEHAPQGGAVQPKAPPQTPQLGLAAVEALPGAGEPAAHQVAAVLRAHPEERDEVMKWLQQNRGNAFVQLVTHQLGQVEQMMPPGVDLQSVRASINIPGNLTLVGNWEYAAKTRTATQINCEVSTKGIQVWLSPGLYLDLTFPARDAELDGASLDFTTGKAHASVRDGGGIGVIPFKCTVAKQVTDMIEGASSGTKLAGHGYDPTRDPDLQGTLNRVMMGFTKLFAGKAGDHATDQKAPIAPEQMTRVSAGATVALKAGASFVKDGAGDLGHVMKGEDAQGTIDAMNVQAVHLSTDGLEVVAKGQPVAKLNSLTLSRGGKITIDDMTPLGKLAKAEAGESGLSLLVALLALRGGDANAAGGAYQNAQHPAVVDGVSRAMIEQTFTDTIHKMILQYRTAVPGIDLAKSLGIG